MSVKVIAVLRNEKLRSKDRIDLLYDNKEHQFILRLFQWNCLRDSIVLEGTEFVALLKAGLVHYKIERTNEDADLFGDTQTDLMQ